MADTLKRYREKRDFKRTSEPAAGGTANNKARAFVIQKHWASRLHYDFRLELGGAMKSWAVPKGPSYDPSVKRMAVQVEDHPIAYNQFEGEIPKGQYGAGKVIIWDEGTWVPVGDARKGYRDGHLKFDLQGAKMQGRWALIRMKGRESEKQPPWLLIKDRDKHARDEDEFSLVDEMPDSVVPLRKQRQAIPQKQTAAAARADAEAQATVPGKPAELPAELKPQLATLVDRPPRDGDDWLYEVKYDGYRILARLEDGQARLYTRNGRDWSARLAHLAKAIAKLDLPSAWIDGEIVVLADNGAPSFQALQNAFESERTGAIVYYVFDMPYVAGRDVRGEPLHARRAWLRQLIAANAGRLKDAVRFSETLEATPAQLVASACKMGLEGIIGKRRDSSYTSRRSETWIKLKCALRQEFVIVGYTLPQGSRSGFGALLLAVHDQDGKLRYAGKVGTGFDAQGLESLARQLQALDTPDSPLDSRAKVPRGAHWVKPVLIAEVSFAEWTASGHVRQASFRGLRSDKPPRDIGRETPMAAREIEADTAAGSGGSPTGRQRAAAAESGRARATAKAKAGKAKRAVRPARLTHPERVIDPSTGLTKLDLARYYGLVAPLLLEHLRGRPVSFVRAPSGIKGELFFQKHPETATMPGIKSLPQRLYPDHPPLAEVAALQGIMSAAQMNVVEFHTWNAIKTSIDKPDRMLFDLDPGAGVKWPAVRQAAELVHVLLRELGLHAWLKTSGGKGLHVVVPLRKQYDWDVVKDFSQAIVRHLARTVPQLFVAKSGPKNRVGKIFADYLRNGFGATTVAAWSARARPGMGVSVPLAWDELGRLDSSDHWTVANIHTRLDVGNAPWDDYKPQAIGAAMKALGFKPGQNGG
ncbi:DNA ligase D [Bordetella sp. BOR01]|uniref:DNA ligase D n=1 Tax=Bordetella sp. BOR01 TaxID=2854779 RepID=UPI001C45586A|nr:DNA ligase D [Bordetella sp. BOR01]MBV7486546.1 DNA ligase D [Bordetella sp. BOR01]